MKILLQLLLIALLSIQPLMAWGNTGHRIVGKVAETYLTKNAKMQIQRFLGHHDLSRVSTWADEIKSDPNWKHAWDWHFWSGIFPQLFQQCDARYFPKPSMVGWIIMRSIRVVIVFSF